MENIFETAKYLSCGLVEKSKKPFVVKKRSQFSWISSSFQYINKFFWQLPVFNWVVSYIFLKIRFSFHLKIIHTEVAGSRNLDDIETVYRNLCNSFNYVNKNVTSRRVCLINSSHVFFVQPLALSKILTTRSMLLKNGQIPVPFYFFRLLEAKCDVQRLWAFCSIWKEEAFRIYIPIVRFLCKKKKMLPPKL